MTDTQAALGFNKRSQHAGGTFFHVFDKSLVQKSKVEIDGWEGPIPTTHPVTKKEVHTWVIRYDNLAAFLIDANWYKKEFTQEEGGGRAMGLKLTLLAGDQRGVLDLKWQDKGPEPVFKRFLKIAPNINLEMPLLISVFKNREGKVAVSYRQGNDPDPQKWVKVDEYWKREVDAANGQPKADTPSTGADGTVLPQPKHDDFNDTWDYSEQNRFLRDYFVANVEPKIKAIAERHGVKQGADDDFYTADDAHVPEVTERPANSIALSLSDMATGNQKAQITQLSQALGINFEADCEKVLNCKYDELNKEGASFAIYKMSQMAKEKGIQVAQPAAPQAPPLPEFTGSLVTPEAPAVAAEPAPTIITPPTESAW